MKIFNNLAIIIQLPMKILICLGEFELSLLSNMGLYAKAPPPRCSQWMAGAGGASFCLVKGYGRTPRREILDAWCP